MKRYPFRPHNDFSFIVGGDRFLKYLLEAIAEARAEILFEMYLVEAGVVFDKVWQGLLEACERGVAVKLLLDGFGAREVIPRIRQQALSNSQLECHVYNPVSLRRMLANFRRDHRKLIVFDRKKSVISGFGITDDFYGSESGVENKAAPAWLDVAIAARGLVVGDWVDLFSAYWPKPLASLSAQTFPEYMPTDGGKWGRVAYGARWNNHDIMREFRARMRKAKRCVWVISPYFLTSWRVRRMMRKASRKGVDVRVLVPGGYTDHPPVTYAMRRYYQRLILAGVRLFEYQPSFIHVKLYCCDDWVSAGSFNLDHWTYRFNLEANQEVLDPGFAVQIQGFYQHCQEHSVEINQAFLNRMRLLDRLLVYLLGKVDEWVMRVLG